MGKYDTAMRCAQIRNLIEENQYLTAMEEIEHLNFEQIPTISDLYLFAEIFLKAEKLDVAKELYYTAYRRTVSRPALYRLLMLVIRMGDVEEAKDLYLAYEIIAGMTLDTYELRYRLAKASGESRSQLIGILEELKKEEYTEEWGLQLARLYELEGLRDQCIEECQQLIRWFAVGSCVDKAKELMERCMSPNWVKPVDEEIPEIELLNPEEEPQTFAYAPAKVEELSPEEEVSEELESVAEEAEEVEEEEVSEELEPVAEEAEAEEVEEEEVSEELEPVPEEAEEQEEEEVSEELEPVPEEAEEQEEEEVSEESEPVPEEAEEELEPEETKLPKKGFLSRLVSYFKVDLDSLDDEMEDFPEELDTYKQQSTAEINVKAILAEGVDGIMEEEPVAEETEVAAAETVAKMTTAPISGVSGEKEILMRRKSAKLPVESLEKQLQEAEQQKQTIRLEDTMEFVPTKSHPLGKANDGFVYEDVSPNGIRYCTLKGGIYRLQQDRGLIHFALSGGADEISLAVAKKLFKELKKIHYFEAKNIGKISADKFGEVNLEEWAEKFVGGCMFISDAPSLSDESVKKLVGLMKQYQRQIVVILAGDYDEMDAFLSYHKEFEKKITYKIKL